MKAFHCNRCNQRVFFENVRCERCDAFLGYVPELGEISAFEEAPDGAWRSLHPGAADKLYRNAITTRSKTSATGCCLPTTPRRYAVRAV